MKRRPKTPADPYSPQELVHLRKLDLAHNRRWLATLDQIWAEVGGYIRNLKEEMRHEQDERACSEGQPGGGSPDAGSEGHPEDA